MEDTSQAIHPDHSGPVIVQEAWLTSGKFVKLEQDESLYICRAEHANFAIVFLSDDCFRIQLFKGDKPDLSTTTAIVKEGYRPTKVQMEENAEEIIFRTASIILRMDKDSFTWTVLNHSGQVVARQSLISWNPRSATTAVYDMPAESHFYGLGEKASFLDKRGEHYTNWNTDVYAPHLPEIEALYQSVPFLIHMHSGLSYGIFVDNPGRTDFDMRSHQIAYTIGSATGNYDLYFIYGPDMKEVVARYTTITGKISLPPKWAIGYHQSRYSYETQEEVLQLARTFREKQIPVDVIYLDIHYMDEYRVFTFDPVRFPDPKGMIKELQEMGIRIVPIVDPGVKKDPKYKQYIEGVQNGYFSKKLEGEIFFGDVWPGASAFPDFTDDQTAEWWGEQHRFYTDLGIRGIWNDMNEPAVFNESKTMDLDVVHRNNGKPKTHEELHNLYGMLMSKATFEGMRKLSNDERPFVLTRAGYSGIQRYAAVWTGDNRSFWEHMAMAMPMVLNMGLSGIAFAGPDIGGFAHHTSDQLLVRWTQMGVFFPYTRNHSAIGTMRQEPWSFGEDAEKIIRKYIGLRYRWMPHMYNLFHETSKIGLPVMRPLLLEYQDDPNVTNLSDQFLLGSNVLIAPIYRPDTDHRAVYLPAGQWIDYWTGEQHEGGRHILAHAPLDTLPIYVKSGSFITEGPLKQYADEQLADLITFHLYGASSDRSFSADYTLYEDDGVTFAFERGQFSELAVKALGNEEGLTISYSYHKKGYQANRGSLQFALHNTEFEVSSIVGLDRLTQEDLDNGKLGWTLDEAKGIVLIQVAEPSEGGEITIRKA
ncbi:TIM-barrel domain-containing protein [Paenibacillus sediminis]|uniref:Alpha-glucosidase n=1 Tax=Paenibacillus sediminis TaxID=664909 RepID=A0ABS4H7N8_9BACL|nr:TIM-barrel domain-containing protein [Paenibacillus sediminis]MBP1938539.1 alpha-glucosidase [Paenibacillus sediminis]